MNPRSVRRMNVMQIILKVFLLLLVPFIIIITITVASAEVTIPEKASPCEPEPVWLSSSFNKVIEVNFAFDDLEFHKLKGYDIVKIKGCSLTMDIGEPKLPVKTEFISIPKSSEVIDIEFSSESEEVEGKFTIYPTQPPAITRSMNQNFIFNHTIYNNLNPYPQKSLEYHVGRMRDHKIVAISVYPLQYIPVEGKLVFHRNISVKITLTGTETGREGEENLKFMQKDNFSSPRPNKYIIITSEELEESFKPLADWKTKKGIPASIFTTQWIENRYEGVDKQEKIRRFITDEVENNGTIFVLLGGDTSIIPERGAYGFVKGLALGEYEDKHIPADLYYADLDGNWDEDNDTIYGEVEDNIDLYPDVFVGRAPVDTVEEAMNFVNKTIRYEKSPMNVREVLLLAERLDDDTDGGDMKELIADLIPSGYNLTRLYEKYGNASRESAIEALNDNPHIVNHDGHGNYDGFSVNGWISREDASNLNNSCPFLIYSISCLSNSFERDSISEHFINNEIGGAFAYIGNSRYGLYVEGLPGEGPSDMYDTEFFNIIYRMGIYRLGEAFAYSKVFFVPYSREDGNGMRWVQYSLNLLGDPEIEVWTEEPGELNVSNEIEDDAIKISVRAGEEPIEGALVCLQGKDIYAYGYTDSDGEVIFELDIPEGEDVNLTVTRHNFLPYEGVLKGALLSFDTGNGTYPSISGTHTGTIIPYSDINVSKLYTYSCPGTGGHSEYVWIHGGGVNETASWNGYRGDWHNISFARSFTLRAGVKYNYTIITGSYPQIIHEDRKEVKGGIITCNQFTDANGRTYNNWIPAIRLWSGV